MIKSIPEDNVLTSLVAYRRRSVLDKVGWKVWVWRYIMISPYQRSSVLIRKRDSSGNESTATFFVAEWGKSHINSAKTKDFLDLAQFEFQVKLLEYHNPFGVFSP
jgi:hypothetical protein